MRVDDFYPSRTERGPNSHRLVLLVSFGDPRNLREISRELVLAVPQITSLLKYVDTVPARPDLWTIAFDCPSRPFSLRIRDRSGTPRQARILTSNLIAASYYGSHVGLNSDPLHHPASRADTNHRPAPPRRLISATLAHDHPFAMDVPMNRRFRSTYVFAEELPRRSTNLTATGSPRLARPTRLKRPATLLWPEVRQGSAGATTGSRGPGAVGAAGGTSQYDELRVDCALPLPGLAS